MIWGNMGSQLIADGFSPVYAEKVAELQCESGLTQSASNDDNLDMHRTERARILRELRAAAKNAVEIVPAGRLAIIEAAGRLASK